MTVYENHDETILMTISPIAIEDVSIDPLKDLMTRVEHAVRRILN